MNRVVCIILACLLVVSLTGWSKSGGGGTITVQNTVIGKTPEYMGACEGGSWNVADLVDCGMRSIRFWVDMTRTEPTDDDGVYGSPTIAAIKANPNIINWSLWDQRLSDPAVWDTNQGMFNPYSWKQALTDCKNNGITPLLCLRNRDTGNNPTWAPQPPFDTTNPDALNEWWEFCFALAYWCNVLNNFGFTEWQCINEPDMPGQGWTGNEAQYADAVKQMYDAVSFANNMAGLPVFMHVGNGPSWSFMYTAFDLADAESQVADYHYYRNSQTSQGSNAYGQVNMHNPDGVVEPLWNSEWGTYRQSYATFSDAMVVADDLYEFAMFDTTVGDHCRGCSIFIMWDWGGSDGLVNQNGSKNPVYYGYRAMNRGLNGYKDRLQATGATGQFAVTRDATKVYVTVINSSSTFTVNLSALGITNATATLYNFSSTQNDVVVANPVVSGGNVSFTGVGTGIAVLAVPR